MRAGATARGPRRTRLRSALLRLAGAGVLAAAPAAAQDRGTLARKPLPPLADPSDPNLAAKQVFGQTSTPADLEARSIGFYAKGCLAGARALPIDGETWQVMRPSRNRNWGNPKLIAFLERFARAVPARTGWPGLLVGDISQPRGGPMLTGHASHQVGLDADIWLSPMPARTLSRQEREFMAATDMVRPDRLDVDPARWTPRHMALIKAASEQPEVERIFVNPAIDQAGDLPAGDRRPPLARQDAAHVGPRLPFPPAPRLPGWRDELPPQPPVSGGEGCDASLAWWFKPEVLHPRPDPTARPKPPITLADLPQACRRVLATP